jgi:hypothetical protein
MNKTNITKVSVFDFDGTLIDTEMEDVGKKIWEKSTGKKWEHRGWWSKRESLDVDIFENEPFDDIVTEFKKEIEDDNTFVSLCTGRIVPLRKQVEAILDKYDFVFDEVVLAGQKPWNKGAGDTLKFKINYLDDLKNRFPNLEEIEFWDDRNAHIDTFRQWGKLQEIPVQINHVHVNNR